MQAETETLSNSLPSRSLYSLFSPSDATTPQSYGSLSLRALSLPFVLAIISINFFSESGAKSTHTVYTLLLFFDISVTTTVFTLQLGLRRVLLVYLLRIWPSCRRGEYHLGNSVHHSLFISSSLRVLSHRVVLDHFSSNLSPLLQLLCH